MSDLTNKDFIIVMENLEDAIKEIEGQNQFLKRQILELDSAKRKYMKEFEKQFHKDMSIRR